MGNTDAGCANDDLREKAKQTIAEFKRLEAILRRKQQESTLIIRDGQSVAWKELPEGVQAGFAERQESRTEE